jgi:hypothetical protein
MRRTLCALLLLLVSPAIASAAPTIADVLPADGAWTNNETFSASVIGGANLVVTVNGVSASAPEGSVRYSADNVPLSEDANPNAVTITATDDTGTTSVTISVKFDKTAPVITIDDPSGDLVTDFRSLIVSGSVHDQNGIDRFVVGNSIRTLPDDGNYHERVDLAAGANSVQVAARDPAQNVGRATIKVTWAKVCLNPTFPSDPSVPQPTPITVDRSDDLADPNLDDDKCDVRPDLRPPPVDPSNPDTPPPFVPPGLGHCTLRAAIQTANHHPGPDRIRLSSPVKLTRVGAGEDAAATGDLDVTDELQILGNGRDSAIIDGSNLGDRVLDVHDGVKLQLVNVTVTGGRTPKPAVRPTDPNDAERGGCVRSRGSLRANNAAFLNCKADGSGGAISVEPSLVDPSASATLTCAIVARSQAKLDGGGVAFDGVPLTLRDSTFSLNSAGRRGGAVSGIGGAASNDLVLKNVTVSQNRATVAGGAVDVGDAHASINNCTFARNSARVGATLSTTGSGEIEISNSILGDTAKLACDPHSPEPVVSLGGNIDRGDSCNLGPSELTNTDPKLDKLATNLGPPTHALKIGSPAIDYDQAGKQTPCEALDARDVERGDWPLAGGGATSSPPFCDAGAFELRTPTPP